jgi:guanosine-3',5'-bis(diphosphate) 3'-pyrophosphohydrolase
MMVNLILEAAKYAADAHEGQTRDFCRGTPVPYKIHLARVAGRVMMHPDATDEMAMAAFLHDTVEDTEKTFDDLAIFPPRVVELCKELHNPSKGMDLPRGERKKIDREHLKTISREGKIIKLYDRIDNINDLVEADDRFKIIYCKESRLLAHAIGDAAPELEAELLEAIEKVEAGIVHWSKGNYEPPKPSV